MLEQGLVSRCLSLLCWAVFPSPATLIDSLMANDDNDDGGGDVGNNGDGHGVNDEGSSSHIVPSSVLNSLLNNYSHFAHEVSEAFRGDTSLA